MATIDQLVSQLGAGWTVANGNPVEETTPVSQAGAPGTGNQTVNRGTGRYYVIVKDDQGHQRALFLHAQPIKGGLNVRQSGVNDQPDPTTGKTPDNLYDGDLKSLQWDQAGAVTDVPATPKQPSPTAKLDRLKGGQVIPAGDTTTQPDQLRDPATGTTVDVPKDPAGAVTAVGNNFYVIKPDGSSTLVTDKSGQPVTKQTEAQALNVPGIGVVSFDPAHPENSKVIIQSPTGVQAKDLKPEVRNGKTYIPGDDGNGGITWTETNLPTDKVYTVAQNDPRSSKVLLIDQQGNSTTVDKPDFHPPPNPQAGQALTPDTTAPFTVTIGDDGKPVYTENKNQQSITQAQQDLIKQLGGKVAAGSMTEKEAQDLITNTTQAMTAQAAQQNAQANTLTAQTGQQRLGLDAATNAITGVNNAAQTGAGLLQNRVTAATGALNQVVGQLGSGNLMGGLPSGWGSNLTNGLQEWVTGLGGGQPVYDSAAAMVNQANPTISKDPTVANQAYTALRGMMDLYKQQTGQDWQPKTPFTSPTTAAQPSDGQPLGQTTAGVQQNLATTQQTNAAAAGAAGAQGQQSTAALNARGLLDNPQGRAIAAGQTPVAAQGAATTAGLYNPAYQQGMLSAVGRPATGPVVGSTALPMIQTPWYPGAQPFQAPVTAAA
jgi:hypothetical protein